MKKIIIEFLKVILLLSVIFTARALGAQDKITFTTEKNVGEKVKLVIDAELADRPDVWIDLNGNGIKDSDEAITEFSSNWQDKISYKIASQNLTLYGKVTYFSCWGNKITSVDISGNLFLKSFICRENQLTSIDVSNNIALTSFSCSVNQLTSIDVSKNVNLTDLGCHGNKLTSLDISNNTALTSLSCRYNQLRSLDVSNNIHLTYLRCHSNRLTSLDVSECPELKQLFFSNNQITSIDVSNNPDLVQLNCNNNQLVGLDISSNPVLIRLYCYNNKLSYLTANNGHNDNFFNFDATENPNLYCIKVDDGFDPEAQTGNKEWEKDDIAIWNNDSEHPCEELTADSLKITLATTKTVGEKISLSINADEKDKPYVWLDLNNNGIKDTGEKINNFAAGDAATDYVLGAQNITLYGRVKSLFTTKNDLTKLDISGNNLLEILNCADNKLTTLDISENGLLSNLVCSNNSISSLDVNKTPILNKLNCSNNKLSDLDINKNYKLTYLSCKLNSITALDVRSNVILSYLDCANNELGELKVNNGNNDKFTYFDATNNGNLECIQLDDGFTPQSFWKKDESTDWNNDSNHPCEETTAYNYKIIFTTTKAVGETVRLKIDAASENLPYVWLDLNNNGTKEENEVVTSSNHENYTIGAQTITIYGKVKDFHCSNNKITSLDASNNTVLTKLYCASNNLTNLNINGCISLKKLLCERNDLKSLNVSGLTSLEKIECYQNRLIDLDVSKCSNLKELSCSYNYVLKSLNISECTALEKLECSQNDLEVLNTKTCTSLVRLVCGDNKLTSLDLSLNTHLTYLSCNSNKLTSLDISNNTALKFFSCQNGKLTSLDFSQNTSLTYMNCRNNELTYLTVNNGNNQNFVAPSSGYNSSFNATENPNLYCIKVDDGFNPEAQTGNDKWLKDDIATWNNDSEHPCEELTADLFKIILVTTKNVGEKISLSINADERDKPYVWLDLNNNGVKDTGEKVSNFAVDNTTTDYVLGAQNITLYGRVKSLFSSKNDLTKLDISGNNLLEILNCAGNKLTTLDVSKHGLLSNLVCYGNDIGSLNITKNSELSALNCSDNKLRDLDVSKNSKLTYLSCKSNSIATLDIREDTVLNYLDCADNELNELKVNNGNNDEFTYFDATNNVDLQCIQLDDGFTPQSFWKKDESTNWNNDSSHPCEETTADNYKIRLVTSKEIGKKIALDIRADEKDRPYVWLDLNNNGTKDAGEAVTNFTNTVYTIGATTVDLYGKVNSLTCKSNQITSIDIRGNTKLEALFLDKNQLKELELRYNEKLKSVGCSDNALTAIDVSKNINLKFLRISGNAISNIDLRQNKKLYKLVCDNTSLNVLDLSQNEELQELVVQENGFTILDVSLNKKLKYLNCSGNQLATLDFSENKALSYLDCSSNQLVSLNVANGNNANFKYPWTDVKPAFDAKNNPDLGCIQIDAGFDPDGLIDKKAWEKDVDAEYSSDCGDLAEGNTYVPDDNFEQALIDLGWDSGELNDSVPTANIRSKSALDLKAKNIADLTGIEDFKGLTWLNIQGNKLISFDISNNTLLSELFCNDNQLTALDLTKNTNLTKLNSQNNKLSALDLSKNTALKILDISGNQLDNLDISKNTALQLLWSKSNKLTKLDLSLNKKIVDLDCSDNQLESLSVKNGNNANVTQFNATGNTNLECIDIDNGFTPPASWLKDETSGWNNDIFLCDPDATDDLADREALKVYPNPVINVITIELGEQSAYKKLQVLTLSGKVILMQDIQSKLTRVDVSKFPQGIYFVKVGSDVRKILIN